MNAPLNASQMVQLLNEALNEAVADMPEAEQGEAKAAILNAFGFMMAK